MRSHSRSASSALYSPSDASHCLYSCFLSWPPTSGCPSTKHEAGGRRFAQVCAYKTHICAYINVMRIVKTSDLRMLPDKTKRTVGSPPYDYDLYGTGNGDGKGLDQGSE
ncbi:hypothetical protein K435DRAFT_800014 [Dendrothele bispora CBS 962.96]|uniref:Uncharacterized protein n=1 Tax=Dendrothele bispora (strain CBS 962.96) TaxID=1314807 RepID=A0A4S8LTZ6_DENBC|nr:hypothetical protein K435DRAFT_800014 [Dendrothele bispora CBS 962.96]